MVQPYRELIEDEAQFSKYVDKFLIRGLINCLTSAKQAEPQKLAEDSQLLFDANTWRSNIERYFEFDKNVFLSETPQLDSEEAEMRKMFEEVSRALVVSDLIIFFSQDIP